MHRRVEHHWEERRISNVEKKFGTGKNLRINEEITRVSEVRLIDEDGGQVGVVSISEARRMSQDVGLDLVELSPDAKPPVCRIMDYGKYIYEQQKSKRKAAKKQKKIQLKEIKIRPATEEADYQVKLRSLMRFLEEGDKAKVTVRFRGRELSHAELGMQLMERIMADLVDLCVVEQRPKFEGRQIIMLLGPKKA